MLARTIQASTRIVRRSLPRTAAAATTSGLSCNGLSAAAKSYVQPSATSSLRRAYHSSPTARAHIYYDTEESEAIIGKLAPTFTAPAVIDGEISSVDLESYRGKWTVLLFYPKDFTFVCPTEIIAFSDRHREFEELNAQVLALSTDTEESHLAWTRLSRKKGGLGHMQIPIVADTTKSIAADYGVLLPEIGIALRGLFIINPEGVLEQITINNLPVGRSVDETLRLLQAYQFVAEHGEVCPANWKPGSKSMKGDPEGSLEYFASGATDNAEEEDPLEPSEKMVVIRSAQDYEDVMKETKAVVDFVAPYCGKCRQIMPFVKELAEEYPDITFAKFDTTEDALVDLSSKLGVQALPAFHMFVEGKPFGEIITGYKKRMLKDAVAELNQAK